MNDLIERQAAIDALRVAYWDDKIQSAKDDPCIVDAMTDWAIRQVKALPSAQPELLTDAEQRIFIEAMWREKDVCRAVDKEFPNAEVNLTDVCREIVRKVKGVLWT